MEGLKLSTATRLGGVEGRQQADLTGQQLTLDLSRQRMQLQEGRLEGSLQHPRLGESALPLALAFAMEADLAESSAQLRDMLLTGPDDLRLSGNLNLAELDTTPTYSGQVSLAPLSLRPWLARIDQLPSMAGPQALSDVALTSPIRGDLTQAELSGLTLVLDDSTFTGRLGMGFDGRLLSLALQGDSLNLDHYLPPPNAGEQSASRRGFFAIRQAHAGDAAPLVPAEWLSELSLDADLDLEHLKLGGLDFTDVDLTLSGSDGRQRLEGASAKLYGGELKASGELDLTRDPIRWQLSPELSRVRLEPLLQALAGDDSPAPLRGRLSLEGALEARYNTLPALRRSLSGRLNGHIDEGAVLDVNVSEELCTLAAMVEGKEMDRDWSDDTRFDRAEVSLRISDGVARSESILVTIPGIELDGEGELDLVTERFDLRAAARFVDAAEAACSVNPRLERVPLPVRCTGELGGDSGEWCRFDRNAFQATLVELLRDEVSRRAGDEIERRLERPLERLEERLGEDGKELREALRGLFN
ncbi:AsmA family protein [Halomonas sp. BC04]|uniref:AsmA family protein n=1 Tax=Halomonas sp. BC04 TaxID=1403540 RepID=UPI0004ACE284